MPIALAISLRPHLAFYPSLADKFYNFRFVSNDTMQFRCQPLKFFSYRTVTGNQFVTNLVQRVWWKQFARVLKRNFVLSAEKSFLLRLARLRKSLFVCFQRYSDYVALFSPSNHPSIILVTFYARIGLPRRAKLFQDFLFVVDFLGSTPRLVNSLSPSNDVRVRRIEYSDEILNFVLSY